MKTKGRPPGDLTQHRHVMESGVTQEETPSNLRELTRDENWCGGDAGQRVTCHSQGPAKPYSGRKPGADDSHHVAQGGPGWIGHGVNKPGPDVKGRGQKHTEDCRTFTPWSY